MKKYLILSLFFFSHLVFATTGTPNNFSVGKSLSVGESMTVTGTPTFSSGFISIEQKSATPTFVSGYTKIYPLGGEIFYQDATNGVSSKIGVSTSVLLDEFNYEGFKQNASTNTRVAVFSTSRKTPTNGYITVDNTDSGGFIVTANTAGIFNGCFYQGGGNACYQGWSKNSSQLTTDFSSITRSSAPCGLTYSGGGNNTPVICCSLKMATNDFMRVHINGACTFTALVNGQVFGTFTKSE